MAKKKRAAGAQANPSAKKSIAKKGSSTKTWVAAVIAVVAIGVVIATTVGGGAKGGTSGTATGSAAGATAASNSSGSVPADEQRYIGRLLPAKYVEPSVASASTYSITQKMANVTPTQAAKTTSVPVKDVVADKIVSFEYKKAGSDPVPMIAYVKPSGKLFVGVSYCIPCKGIAQRIDADGTLTCESCGTKRDLETGVGLSGTCRLYPLDELPATVTGGKIVLQNNVIDSWTAQPLDRPVGA